MQKTLTLNSLREDLMTIVEKYIVDMDKETSQHYANVCKMEKILDSEHEAYHNDVVAVGDMAIDLFMSLEHLMSEKDLADAEKIFEAYKELDN